MNIVDQVHAGIRTDRINQVRQDLSKQKIEVAVGQALHLNLNGISLILIACPGQKRNHAFTGFLQTTFSSHLEIAGVPITVSTNGDIQNVKTGKAGWIWFEVPNDASCVTLEFPPPTEKDSEDEEQDDDNQNQDEPGPYVQLAEELRLDWHSDVSMVLATGPLEREDIFVQVDADFLHLSIDRVRFLSHLKANKPRVLKKHGSGEYAMVAVKVSITSPPLYNVFPLKLSESKLPEFAGSIELVTLLGDLPWCSDPKNTDFFIDQENIRTAVRHCSYERLQEIHAFGTGEDWGILMKQLLELYCLEMTKEICSN